MSEQNINKAFVRTLGCCIILGVFWTFPFVVLAAVQISEVQCNPVGTDTGAEYIAIRNNGSTTEQLSGWQLYPDGIGYFVFGDTSLAPGSTLTIRLRASGTNTAGEIFHSAATSNMGNTSGSVALFNSSDRSASTMVDFVEWGKAGETWESAADSAGMWTKGTFVDVTSASEGQALKRTGTGNGAAAWTLGSASTPTPVSTSESTGGSQQTTESTGGASTPTGAAVTNNAADAAETTYRVRIDVENTATVGGVTTFSGTLLSPSGSPVTLNTTQYIWNFGDGAIANGRSAEHIYLQPGTYTVSLTVPHDRTSLTAYAKISATPATVRITEILPGDQGWIEITNGAPSPLHLSRWILVSGSSSFLFPAGTTIAAGASVAFPVSSTKIVIPSASPSVTLQLSNGIPADTFSTIALIPPGMSAARSGESIIFGAPTPGAHATLPQAPASVSEKQATPRTSFTNTASAAVKTTETTIIRTTATATDTDAQIDSSKTAAASSALPREYWYLGASVLIGGLLGMFYYRVRASRAPKDV